MELSMQKEIATRIKGLEERLLMPSVRKSVQELELLLSDDFVEIARTGKKYSKSDVIGSLLTESTAIEWTLSDFTIRMLSDQIALANYLAKRVDKAVPQTDFSFRSSIWVNREGHWQMVFHQGTLININ